VKEVLPTVRRVPSLLVAVIGRETEKYYVSAGIERPWTAEEDADFLAFCETIDVPPTDPELAAAMEDGDLDFFNNDIWIGLKLYSC
jgi:hypothetical protein